jgi:hypothetical protein
MQVYSEDAEFGDAVASRGEAKRGKDFVIAAADESTDVSSWQSHFLLVIAWN